MDDIENKDGLGKGPSSADATSSLGTGGTPESVGVPAPFAGGAPQTDQQQGDQESPGERTQFPDGGDQSISAKQNTGDDQDKI